METDGKPRIIIWFVSNDRSFIKTAINILESQHNGVGVLGVTSTQKTSFDDLPFIPLNEISMNSDWYDIILVAGGKKLGMTEVVKFANALKLDTEKLLGDWIVCIPGFTLQKYRQLQHSQLSIFAQNCFGSVISNTLGLPFRSPFVNMFVVEDEYIRFLRSPRIYMEEKLVFRGVSYDENTKINYPIFIMGNIFLHMNHYPDFNEAVAKWNERKPRINWYNLFVMANTEKPEILEEFNKLPFGKKVCFVPFKSDLDSAWYINPEIRKDLNQLWQFVIGFSLGKPFYYDPFDMLLYGKKTQLIDM